MLARIWKTTRRSFSTRSMYYASSKEDVDNALVRMSMAQEKFMDYTQKDVDHIVEYVSNSMKAHAYDLAKQAVEESGIGCVEDKTLKNLYATEHTLAKYKNLKTAGVIDHNVITGISKIAEPVGPICAILPCTNPIATTIIKSLYSIKTRNCIFLLPHPRSKVCSIRTANLIQEYATIAGAPTDIILSAMPTRDISEYVMRHKEIRFLLATGGSDMVRACYSVGKPAIGVGPGNTPVMIDGTYDLRESVNSVLIGKTFDWGVPCITEQSVILLDSCYDKGKELFRQRGVHFLTKQDQDTLSRVFFVNNRVNPAIVGKSPQKIGEMASIYVPKDAICIGVETDDYSLKEPFAHEKMSPILTLYRAETFQQGVEMCRSLALEGGPGHSSCIYTSNEGHLSYFQRKMPTYHINVNMPAMGGIGIRYNPNMSPTMTVGCGIRGGSISSVNVGPNELLQLKHVVRKVDHHGDFQTPIILQKELSGCFYEIKKDDRRCRAVVVADGQTIPLVDDLVKKGYHVWVYSAFEDKPTVESVQRGVELMVSEQPSVLIVAGGEQVIDIAKWMRLCYDNPHVPISTLSSPFIENNLRQTLVPVDTHTRLVVIPSASACGSEMTPFTQTVVSGQTPCTVWLDALRPDIVIYDPNVLAHTRPSTVVESGFRALLQGIESYASATGHYQSRLLAKDAIRTLFHALENPHHAQEVIHAIGNIGLAMGNSGLGLATSMAVTLQARHGCSIGATLGVLAPQVMVYNMTDAPTRVASFPSYPYPKAREHYHEIAEHLGIGGDDRATDLVYAVMGLRARLGFPSSLSTTMAGYTEEMLHGLAESTFGQQFGSTNPRTALISEIKQLYHSGLRGLDPLTNEGTDDQHTRRAFAIEGETDP